MRAVLIDGSCATQNILNRRSGTMVEESVVGHIIMIALIFIGSYISYLISEKL